VTLIIAYLLMIHAGYSDAFLYFGVFLIWILHLAYHDADRVADKVVRRLRS